MALIQERKSYYTVFVLYTIEQVAPLFMPLLIDLEKKLDHVHFDF